MTTQIYPNITERNAQFELLDLTGKRMAVVRDTKMLVENEKIDLTPSYYLVAYNAGVMDAATPLHSLLEDREDKTSTCKACAMGSLFLGHVYNTNECVVGGEGDLDNDTNIEDRLEGLWSELELRLIEWVFEDELIKPNLREALETTYGEYLDERIDAFRETAYYESQRYGTISNRTLNAILDNMLAHEGHFVLPDWEEDDAEVV